MLIVLEFGKPFIWQPSFTRVDRGWNLVWGWTALRYVKRSFYDLATKKFDWVYPNGERFVS